MGRIVNERHTARLSGLARECGGDHVLGDFKVPRYVVP